MSRKKANNVPDKIKASLVDLQMLPWLPQLTATLVEKAWESLHCRTGITVLDYGTARVLAGKRNAPRHITTRLPICLNRDDMLPMLTEVLAQGDRRRYEDTGLVFYAPDETIHTAIVNCLQEAFDLLRYVPTLQTTVAALVRICHVLKPGDDDYDVSHSDPQIPFSIFVSVLQRRRPNNALRVIESIVHEAMHLQLTLIEHDLPLVDASASTHFSPWKGTYRSPQGVLHALYVFRVIDRFFERLQMLSVADANYISNRREEISQQIDEIRMFKKCAALTTWGSDFVRRLMSPKQTCMTPFQGRHLVGKSKSAIPAKAGIQ